MPILRMVKEEQNPFMVKEKQNQSMEDELAKIELIISCFNIEENIDEKINFNHIAKIFDGAILQTRVVDNEVLYLLKSLPSSIQNEISRQFNDQLTVVDNEQFVKMHFIIPV
ncbi:hypothetical protein II654_02010, partial [bacterium]|nr:hypothetical protein [bacterium]